MCLRTVLDLASCMHLLAGVDTATIVKITKRVRDLRCEQHDIRKNGVFPGLEDRILQLESWQKKVSC